MEKPKLQKKELEELRVQYYGNNEYLCELIKTKKSPIFKTGTEAQKKELRFQINFFKMAVNDGVRVLIDHDFADTELLSHAVGNRNLTFRTRWQCLKLLAKRPLREWL